MTSYMTKATHIRLQERFNFLTSVEKPAIIKEIATTREFGDLKENAEYHAAKDKQKLIMAEMQTLVEKLEHVEFIDDLPIRGDVVSLGTCVVIQDDNGENMEYSILGQDDSNTEKSIISFMAPLARGLMGKKKGDTAILDLPGKKKSVKIVDIKPYFSVHS